MELECLSVPPLAHGRGGAKLHPLPAAVSTGSGQRWQGAGAAPRRLAADAVCGAPSTLTWSAPRLPAACRLIILLLGFAFFFLGFAVVGLLLKVRCLPRAWRLCALGLAPATRAAALSCPWDVQHRAGASCVCCHCNLPGGRAAPTHALVHADQRASVGLERQLLLPNLCRPLLPSSAGPPAEAGRALAGAVPVPNVCGILDG